MKEPTACLHAINGAVYMHFTLLTFQPVGGGHKVAPFGFSAIAQKRVAIATQNFA